MILVERYNSILQEAVERGKPVPFGTYILTKPDLKLVPVRILVDFNRKRKPLAMIFLPNSFCLTSCNSWIGRCAT
jgi:hypothetical protein